MTIDCRGRVVPVVGNSETVQMEADGMRKMMMMKEEEIRDRMVPAARKSATAQMKDDGMNTMISMVGNTKVERWFDGVVPYSVEDATLLGYSNNGQEELALYELKNGNFCSINKGEGELVYRQDFPQVIMGYKWTIEDSDQYRRIDKLMQEIRVENHKSGYDDLKAASDEQYDERFMSKLLTLFVKVMSSATPPDLNASNEAVIFAICDEVNAAIGWEDSSRSYKLVCSIHHNLWRYVDKLQTMT